MTIGELLDALPDGIPLPCEFPIWDDDEEYWYEFNLTKNKGEYELSYYCWLKDDFLVSYSGCLYSVLLKMYKWCKDNNKLTVMNHEDNQESKS